MRGRRTHDGSPRSSRVSTLPSPLPPPQPCVYPPTLPTPLSSLSSLLSCLSLSSRMSGLSRLLPCPLPSLPPYLLPFYLPLSPSGSSPPHQPKFISRHNPNLCQVDTYDGDTPQSDRPRLRESTRIFLTNPDMLHTSLLPSHAQWTNVLPHLALVVIDEAHMYSGVVVSLSTSETTFREPRSGCCACLQREVVRRLRVGRLVSYMLCVQM